MNQFLERIIPVSYTHLKIIPLFSVFIPFLTFSNMLVFVIIGIILWGIVLGVHETIMRAAVADLTACLLYTSRCV